MSELPVGEIICGDCREVMAGFPDGSFDAVVTDPPYPDYLTDEYHYDEAAILGLKSLSCRQLIFWSAKSPFPLDYTAIHIWDKECGCGSVYERVFERNGTRDYRVFRCYLLNSTVAASYLGEELAGHPSQKPLRLMRDLIQRVSTPGDIVLDPYCGSGSTLVACVQTGRRFVGIDISPEYCEIARKRVAEALLQPRLDFDPQPKPEQGVLL